MEDKWEGGGVKIWGHTIPNDKGIAKPRPGVGQKRAALRAVKAQ